MGYNPNEARDYHGRWGSGGAGAPDAPMVDPRLSKMPPVREEPTPENVRKWVDEACDRHGWDKGMVDVTTEPYKFKLNERDAEAGSASSQSGRITVYATPGNNLTHNFVVNDMMPHEIMHQKFATWMSDAKAEYEEVKKIPLNSVPVEGSFRTDENGNQVQRMADAMKPDGTLRPPYDTRYPTYQEMVTLLEGKQGQLQKEDGHTAYSEQWWKEAAGPGREVKWTAPNGVEQTMHVGVGITAPINETLAEMAASHATREAQSKQIEADTAKVIADARTSFARSRLENIDERNAEIAKEKGTPQEGLHTPWGSGDDKFIEDMLNDEIKRIKEHAEPAGYSGSFRNPLGPYTIKADGKQGRSESKTWNALYKAVNNHWAQLTKENKGDPLWYAKHIATKRKYVAGVIG